MYKKFEMLLKMRGITPYQVAKETGISSATLTHWKEGKYTPKYPKIKKIAKFLGVPVGYFYND